MAEARVEQLSNNYFCHKCNVHISPKLPDFVCPRCNSGFIEVAGGSQDPDSDSSSDAEFDVWDMLTNSGTSETSAPSEEAASSAGPRRSQRLRRNLGPRHGRVRYALSIRAGNQRQNSIAPLLQEFLMQMTTGALENVGGEVGIFPGGFELTGIPMLVTSSLASNPGDYAWGRAGLDTIITQLMNQLDGTGPPPLSEEKINQIPIVKITQEQCDKSLQCSVCMEDFALDDSVRKLNCDHCYHEDCILPWLQLHATCPVCRKTLHTDLPESQDSFSSSRERRNY